MADPSVPSRARKLLNWFDSHGGVKSSAVELAEDGQHAFHFRALSNVNEEGSPSKFNICSCPTGLSLSYLNIIPIEETVLDGLSIRFCGGSLTPLWNVVPSHILSRFVLLEQAGLKERSFWAPYIDSLPKSFDTIMYFSSEDLEWLDATNLDTFRNIRHDLWRSEWQLVMDALNEHGIDGSQFSWESYIWAASIFTSRGFDSTLVFPNLALEQFSVLYPFVDSLNHDMNAKVDWDMGSEAFTLNTYETLKQGEEIFNNYGSKGNEELLAGYGFAIPNNPYDQVSVKLGTLIPPIALLILSNQALSPKDINETDLTSSLYLRGPTSKLGAYPNTYPSLAGIPPLLFKVALGIYLYTTSRPDHLRYDLPAEKPGRHVIGAIRHLLRVLQTRRLKLATGTPEGEPANARQRYAAIYRAGQLGVLDANIAALRGVLPEFAGEISSVLAPGSLLNTREAIKQLETEDRVATGKFVEGVGVVLVDPLDDAGLLEADCEDVVWVLWIAYAYVLTEHTPTSKTHAWLRDLSSFYNLTALASSIPAHAPPAYDFALEKIAELADGMGGLWEACRKREEVVYWAAKVVQFEAWQVYVQDGDGGGDDEGGERESRWVMYMDGGGRGSGKEA